MDTAWFCVNKLCREKPAITAGFKVEERTIADPLFQFILDLKG
jgi:hypothetical protein